MDESSEGEYLNQFKLTYAWELVQEIYKKSNNRFENADLEDRKKMLTNDLIDVYKALVEEKKI